MTFFRKLEIDVPQAAEHGEAFERLRRGELHAIIVHNLYPADVLESVVDRLERHDPPFLQTWFPEQFRSWFYGRNLNLTHPDLSDYFREAAEFNAQLESLFPESLGITSYLCGVLSKLDDGRPFRPPPGPHPGQHYMFTTIRAHLEGGYIPAHCDNEQALRPSYRHLNTLIESRMMSYVLALTMPDQGGALEVYDHRFDPTAESPMNDDRATQRPDIDQLDCVSTRLEPGTMMIVDSGRYLHRLSPVVGPRKRWTVCSFLGLSKRHDAVYCWG